jgi:hypothetical protein
MATQVESENGTGLTTLVSGIIQDGQELIKQQLQLFLVELKGDLKRTKDASIPLIIGGLIGALGAFFLLVTVALWLHWQWPNVIPVWGGFAIMTGLFLIAGVVFIVMGKSRFDAFNPLPDKSLQGLQENVQWKTKT